MPDDARMGNAPLARFTLVLIAILFVQLMYGGFMAGLKAAMAAPTWPSINGMAIPGTVFTHNLIRDPDFNALKINVHFVHRTIAYLLLILVVIWFAVSGRSAGQIPGRLFSRTRWWPLLLVFLQVLLGIVTVLCAPMIVPGRFGLFEALAEMHQLVAMFLLMSLVVNFYIIGKRAAVS